MKEAQNYTVESVQIEGENGEFTRIDLQSNGIESDDCTELTILTDSDDASDFKVGQTVRLAFDLSLHTPTP